MFNSLFRLNFDLIDEKSYNYKLKRNLMENIAQKIFLKIEGILAEALIPIKSASLTIDEVLLVGGSTRIPKIKEIIHKYIPDIQFNTSIVPEEAVVRGAAIKAAILAGNTDLEFADVNYAPMLPIYCAIKNSLVRMYVVRKLEMVPSPIGKEAALELPSSELPIEVMPFAVCDLELITADKNKEKFRKNQLKLTGPGPKFIERGGANL